MDLRRRTLLIVLLLLLATLLAIQLVGRGLIYPKFLDLEQEQARRNAELVLEVTNHELQVLAGKPEDWGYWDDTYQFVIDRNTDYVESNLGMQSQLSLKVNLLGIYDPAGRKVWARAMDLGSLRAFDLDEFTASILPADSPFLANENTPRTRAGLVLTSRGVMLVASTPILTSLRAGPRHGTLMMGRFFDKQVVRRIARQGRLQVDFTPHRGASPPAPADTPRGDALANTPLQMSVDADNSYADTVIFSVDGKPALDLRVSTPREISARGRSVLRLSLLGTGVAGIGIALVLLGLLNSGVVVPLVQLTRQARQIGANDDNMARLQFNRRDEIGALAAEFDRMLDRLADARGRLRRESYRSGASEMAGGIVRDLGESLAPVHEQIGQPLRLLDQVHISGMQALVRELAAPGLSHHRQTELIAVLQDHLGEHGGLVSEARGELRGLRKRLEQMQEKVAEYSRFVAGPGILAPIRLSDALEQALRRQPQAGVGAAVRIDDSVATQPPVAAAREVLQQVLHTLLDQVGRLGDGGLVPVRISASREDLEGRAMVCLRFDDERPRADAQRLLEQFAQPPAMPDRGTSLTWAENAVSAMGGRLQAEASENYGGLAVRLLLPQAG